MTTEPLDLSDLASEISGVDGPVSVEGVALRQGVIQRSDAHFFTVRLGGSTVDVPKVKRLAGVEVGQGDTVWLAQHGPTFFILGRVEATRVVEAWQTPTFQNSWVDYGSNYSPARFRKDSDGFVHLQGLIKSGSGGVAAFTLPAGYRPEKRMHFQIITNGVHGYVEVYADGRVVMANVSNVWASLTGIYFPTDTSQWHVVGDPGEPAFENGFTNHDTVNNHGAKFWKDADGVVHLVGIVTHPSSIGNGIFTLPAGYRTQSRRILPTSNNSGLGFVEALGLADWPGLVVRGQGTGWTSLDGVSWATDVSEWERPQLYNSWVPYGNGEYAHPAYFQSDRTGVVRTKGIIKSGTGLVGYLTERGFVSPFNSGTLVHSVVSNSVQGRLDVYKEAMLDPLAPYSNSWLSLDKLVWSGELPK